MPRFTALRSHLRYLTKEDLDGAAFEIALDGMPACIGYVDSHRRYQYVNARYRKLFNLPLDQIVGRTVEKVVGAENYRAVAAQILRTLEGHETEFEAAVEYPGYGLRRTLFKYIPNAGEDGRVQGYFVIATDVTAAHEVTKVLHEREPQFQKAAENAPIMISYCDPYGRYLFVNQVYTQWFGATAGQIVGRHWADVVGKENASRVEPRLARAFQGERVEFLDALSLPDGRRRHMRGVFAPHVEGESVIGVFVVREDVTALYEMVDALCAADGRLSLEQDELTSAICYFDTRERYRFANRKYREWFGCANSEIVGKKVSEVLPPAYYEMVKPRIRRAFRGEVVEIHDVIVLPSGHERLAHVAYRPHIANGKVKGLILVRSDVTGFRRVEAELRHIASHDGLTGLANLRQFRQRFIAASQLADNGSYSLCLLFIKLDGLRAINKEAGRHAVDHVLSKVGEQLRQLCRDCDMVARLGGDDFVVLIESGPSVERGVTLAKKLSSAIKRPIPFGKSALNVRAQIGVALVDRLATSFEEALQKGAEAMMAATHAGKEVAVYGVHDSGDPNRPSAIPRAGADRSTERRAAG